jgi:CubicO group peptidase (beta-lactamase class C family)
MKFKYLLIIAFSTLFFFGEIAISFSDKSSDNALSGRDDLSFALKIANSDSDFETTRPVDVLFESLVEKYKLAGASVAVARHGKIVYAKGFGYANLETREDVQPGHLFRIASVSKLITAVAIMKLAEENRLKLDEKVFGPDGILNDEQYLSYSDKRFENITVHHLLNHTAGWSRRSGDPMFNSLYIARKLKVPAPARLDDIIQFELTKKLSYEPGKVYSYSNFGYALLGKIIERRSGQKYEEYVVSNLMKPLGLNDMHIGRSTYYNKFPNEVKYHEPAGSSMVHAFDGSGRMVPASYGGNHIELLAAAGGWVASAPEMVRFLSAIDGMPGLQDILSDSSLKSMSNPKVAGKGLYGWRGTDRSGTVWRTGSLSGTTAFVMSMDNGMNWVVLINSSSYQRNRIHNTLYKTIFAASKRVTEWPEQDLFLTGISRFNANDFKASLSSLNPGL